MIEQYLKTEFELKLWHAALANQNDFKNPLRLNNFSYAIRELTRHILKRLAPDDDVLKCSWYENETQINNGISRKQRSYYAVQGGLTDSYLKSVLNLKVDVIHKDLLMAIKSLNKYTHIEPETFGVEVSVVESLVAGVTESLSSLFLTIEECRNRLVEAFWEHIDHAVIDEAISDTIYAVDELATHHSIDDVNVEDIEVVGINALTLEFVATGSIYCFLQWGSNSDIRRGDGHTQNQSFPFICHLSSPVDEPESIEIDVESLRVDTSDWYGEE
jgi:hypothetical protein